MKDFAFYVGFYGWPLIIAATIYLNWYRITKRHLKPYYFASNWSRAIFGAVCLILMTIDKGFDPANLATWIPALPSIVYIVSSFYLFFDAGLNGLHKLRWDYKGKDSGVLDKLPKPLYYVLKAVCLAALVLSTIALL